jgi:acetyl-CoA C-acetyltransferase
MGLTEAGQGARAILDGVTAKGGRLPVNPLPVGRTQVKRSSDLRHWCIDARHGRDAARRGPTRPVMCRFQMRRLPAVFNMGGAGVASYLSILERRF